MLKTRYICFILLGLLMFIIAICPYFNRYTIMQSYESFIEKDCTAKNDKEFDYDNTMAVFKAARRLVEFPRKLEHKERCKIEIKNPTQISIPKPFLVNKYDPRIVKEKEEVAQEETSKPCDCDCDYLRKRLKDDCYDIKAKLQKCYIDLETMGLRCTTEEAELIKNALAKEQDLERTILSLSQEKEVLKTN